MFYEKKVRYLDYYRNGDRIKNGGFARTEIRGECFRIELTLKGIPAAGGAGGSVILCAGEREAVLGQIGLQNGCGEFRYEGELKNVAGGEGMEYGELTGIRIPLGEGTETVCRWLAEKGTVPESRQMPAERAAVKRAEEKRYHRGQDFPGQRRITEPVQSPSQRTDEQEAKQETPLWRAENQRTERKAVSQGAGEAVQGIVSQNPGRETEQSDRQQSPGREEEQSDRHQNPGRETEQSDRHQNPGRETEQSDHQQNPGRETEQSSRHQNPGREPGQHDALERVGMEISQEILMQRAERETVGASSLQGEETVKESEIFLQGTEGTHYVREGRGGTDRSSGKQEPKEERGAGRERTTEKRNSRPVKLLEEKWLQLSAIYPHIRPFRDEREYLSIGPSDFVLFSEESYRSVNNSFLLHGYYNYHHLILTRMERRGEILYYAGVPGNYYDREKQVAVMFGFESFECAEEPAQQGDFGYYMMKVKL